MRAVRAGRACYALRERVKESSPLPFARPCTSGHGNIWQIAAYMLYFLVCMRYLEHAQNVTANGVINMRTEQR